MSGINIGLIGAGTVGCGVYKIIEDNAEIIAKRLGARLAIKKIADIDPERGRPVQIPRSMFTTDATELINDESIHIIIELIGGTTVAKDFILAALQNGKHVVTANKALLAHHGREIFLAASENKAGIGFEASVGGGIPIIRAINEGYASNNIKSIFGIMNGTTNYILTTMKAEGREFGDVLAQAQDEGYAEADPTFDIDGIDAAHKISILSMLSYGIYLELESIPVEGIRSITPVDITFADEFGYTIKLLSIAIDHESGYEIGVHPALVKKGTPLADVSGAFNAIYVEGDAVGPTMLYGMGAGMMPTASAVVSDAMHISKDIVLANSPTSVPNFINGDLNTSPKLISPKDLEYRFYIRFQVDDKPGVLGNITSILGKHGVSIESVVQQMRDVNGGGVPVVLMTHEVSEYKLKGAIEEIKALPACTERPLFMRIVDIQS